MAISQQYEYKMFVFEYFGGDILTIKKYRNIHKKIITDLDAYDDAIVTVARDMKINCYNLKFVSN